MQHEAISSIFSKVRFKMRKYQQLVLVLVSIVSLTVLLMYKSENNRLKYVLQVVNFFGRSDATVLARIENNSRIVNSLYDFSMPLPVWQRISNDFHSYSAFWNKNELVAGGEASAVVVGLFDSIINFKCGIRYKGGKMITGKFAFVRIESDNVTQDQEKNKNFENFSIFKFLCKVSRDFGTPEGLIFTDIKSKVDHEVPMRIIRTKDMREKLHLTACVNMIPYNTAKTAFNAEFFTKNNILQFFLHHQAIGIDEFLVYNSYTLPSNLREILYKTGIRINIFPYNFPFDYKTQRTRNVIELDCLLRNAHVADFTILLEPSEFLYTGMNVQFKGSMLKGLKHYDQAVNRYEIPSFSVCIDHRNKLLMDNTLYDPEAKSDHKTIIYKPTLKEATLRNVKMTVSQAFAHTYINCISSKDLLYDWRSSIREDFMQYIKTLRNEISLLF